MSSSSKGSSSASRVTPVYDPLSSVTGHTSTSTSKSTPRPGLNFSSIFATAASSAICACPMARMSFIWRAMGTAAPMIFSHASAETLSFPKWFSTMAVGAFPLRNPGISAPFWSRWSTALYAFSHSSAETEIVSCFWLPGRSLTTTSTAMRGATAARRTTERRVGWTRGDRSAGVKADVAGETRQSAAPPVAWAGIAEPAKAATASGAESAASAASSDAPAVRLTNIVARSMEILPAPPL
mmetsp:Transcript_36437/g.86243  ORF Transcript_36437/g.86243 Transcript_36437/m.86243 type:complete len:240 (-) Transcript_36437:8-727(-)